MSDGEMIRRGDALAVCRDNFFVDDLTEAIRNLPAVTVGAQERVQHKKRGSTYRVLGRGKVQTDTPLSDYAEVVVYQSEADGLVWVRPVSEFDDGRFAALDLTPALPAVTVGVRPLVWEPTDAQVASACMSYRHDFGLMGAEERKLQMFKAREWLRAWQKESAALPAVTPAPDAAALVDQVRFLAERLREWEGDYINHDEAGTQWIGNVIPPLVRLEAILALLPKGGA